MRLVLYRAFLNLAIRRFREEKPVTEDLLMLAASCVNIAVEIIQVTTSSIHAGSSGTLQAMLFQAIEYLWNGAITLMLSLTCRALQERLSSKITHSSSIMAHLNSSIEFFERHADTVPFARTAAEKAFGLLRKMTPDDGGKVACNWVPEPGRTPTSPAWNPNQGVHAVASLDESEFDLAGVSSTGLSGQIPDISLLQNDWMLGQSENHQDREDAWFGFLD
jgi:hypothetical protein